MAQSTSWNKLPGLSTKQFGNKFKQYAQTLDRENEFTDQYGIYPQDNWPPRRVKQLAQMRKRSDKLNTELRRDLYLKGLTSDEDGISDPDNISDEIYAFMAVAIPKELSHEWLDLLGNW